MKGTLRPTLSSSKPAHETIEGEIVDNRRWGTPTWFYDWVDAAFGFTIDVCADEGNYKHPRYYDEKTNGLQQSWRGERFWCNPPYGAGIARWLMKSRDAVLHEEAVGALLVPCRPDTEWWLRYALQSDGEAGRLRASRFMPDTRVHWYRWQRLIVGTYVVEERLKFQGAQHGAPFISTLLMFAPPDFAPLENARARLDANGLDQRFVLTEGIPR